MNILSDPTQTILELQARVLERIAVGAPLREVLALVCELVETATPEGVCSIMLLDEATGALNVAAAPSAASGLVSALNGLVPSDLAGSCGTSVYQRQPVYVEDTGTDPRWEAFRAASVTYGIKACWSYPILMSGGRAAGSFAISRPSCGTPDESHQQLLRIASQLAGIALERTRSHDLLESAVRRYQDLYDSAPDMLASIDPSTLRIVECNRTLADIVGFSSDELVGRSVLDLHHADSRVGTKRVFRMLDGQDEVEREGLQVVRRDGSTIDVNLKVAARRGSDGTVLHLRAVWRDVTRRKRAEEALQRSQRLDSLGVLASGIAHDFNNLLVGITGNAELAALSLDPDSPARRKLAEVLRASARAAELTERLMSYAGKSKLTIGVVDVCSLTRESVELVRSSKPRSVDVVVDCDCEDAMIDGDATQVRQVMINVLVNAFDSIGERGGSVRVSLKTVCATRDDLSAYTFGGDVDPGDYVLVEVTDDGCGIESDVIDRIFDPFFTTKRGGHGLGLASTLGIMRSHRGTLRVESRIGAGSCFRLLFPVSHAVRAADTTYDAPTEFGPGNTSVLVVDDEVAVRKVSSQMLTALGYRAVSVERPSEAVELVREDPNRFGAVLLDLSMPGMSGEEVFEGIRGIAPNLPVVFYSGHSSEAEVQGLLADRAHATFLAKPFRIAELGQALELVLPSR
ncbi:MAG: PAS domain S-box protein [Planctomycetes bacterium]|nr:PAS domain S-box protein [Planctomycetota bacterium]